MDEEERTCPACGAPLVVRWCRLVWTERSPVRPADEPHRATPMRDNTADPSLVLRAELLAALRLLAAWVGLTARFVSKIEATESPAVLTFWIQDLRDRLGLASIPARRRNG